MTDAHAIGLFRKQIQFVKDEHREILMSGGYGTAKTVALCAKVLWHASVPDALVGLTRKTFFSLRQTALRVLLQGSGTMPPILRPGSYSHSKTEHIIKLHGGGEIYYFGCDEPLRLGGITFSAVGADEAIELDEDEWARLIGCIRNTKSRCLQLFAVTNPGPPSHFLYDRFIKLPTGANDQQQAAFKRRATMRTFLEDNPALPEMTVQELHTFTGQRAARYVRGEWVRFEGLVYGELRRDHHGRTRRGPWKRVIVGVDLGFTKPSAVVFLAQDGDGRTHQFRELYETGLVQDELIRQLGRLCLRRNDPDNHFVNGVDRLVVDPSDPGFIEACRRYFQANGLGDVAVQKARGGERKPGIRQCQNQIVDGGDGKPRHTIDPSCEATWRETESYEWEEKRDEPIKEHDHAMDAWRYANQELEAEKGGEVSLAELGERSVRYGMEDGWEAI